MLLAEKGKHELMATPIDGSITDASIFKDFDPKMYTWFLAELKHIIESGRATITMEGYPDQMPLPPPIACAWIKVIEVVQRGEDVLVATVEKEREHTD
jgi:hypothetical protein